MGITAEIEILCKRIERRLYLESKRLRLRNKSATIISSNCNGAFILHDMKCGFNTPTVNLFFMPDDYLRFVQNLKYYLGLVPIEVHDSGVPYPVGQLDDIKIYFMHYRTFDEAKNKWLERSKRVNYDNLFLMMTQQNGCNYNHLELFDRLEYKNKVVFTCCRYPELKSAFYIPDSEEGDSVRVLSDIKPGTWYRRWLDCFDYVTFLNGKGIKRRIKTN